jgi:GGDEF domain-containing protein
MTSAFWIPAFARLCRDGKEIIKKADRALYMAKEQGRNRAVITAYGEQAG